MEDRDKNIITQNQAEDEIDLIDILIKLWAQKLKITFITISFIILGIVLAISTPNEYKASITMVPQTGEKNTTGGLSGLAAIAGINIGSFSSGEILPPSIYPKIINNVNFQKELIYSKYNFSQSDESISYYDYLTNKKFSSLNLFGIIKKYTLGLPSIIIGVFKNNNNNALTNELRQYDTIHQLTLNENIAIKNVFHNLNLYSNAKEGIISITYTCGEPLLAAEVVITAQKLLQKYITEFKIQKVQSNLTFVESSYEDAKRKFEEKQVELAKFRDSNKNLSSEISKTHEEKLISEYNLLLSVYSEIAKQKEQAKIAVKEKTPIFTIIEPVTIPIQKSGPNRASIVIVFAFIGIVLSGGWVIGEHYIKSLIKKLKERFI